jgi:hypothetical protein
MLSKENRIETDELKLQSYARPPLPAGKYSVKTNVNVEAAATARIPGEFKGEGLSFQVTAPRFSIDRGLIHSTYPVEGPDRSYADTMPHIVLSRKTLPWERSVNIYNDRGHPWMSLLLLTEDELQENWVSKIKTSDLFANKTVLTPDLNPVDVKDIDKEIKVLDMPVTLFDAIAPRLDELSYLTHTRQADTTQKEDNSNNPYGWYSVLVGNRMPKNEAVNHMFMVSLEGYGKLLDNTDDRKSKFTNMRLVVLHQWHFKSTGATFTQLLKGLNGNIKPLSVELPESTSANGIPGEVATALKFGYTPLSHVRRNGLEAPSWYRGPLTPVAISKPEEHYFKDADEALRFDKPTAMFDVSYSVAWQLGRLLALKDPGFSVSISNWKNAYKRDRPIDIAKEVLKAEGVDTTPDKLASLINTIEGDDVLTDYMIELWAENAPSI